MQNRSFALRILSAALALLLLGGVAAPAAQAELKGIAAALNVAYTHPEAGFSIAIPQGWYVIDKANADDIQATIAARGPLNEWQKKTLGMVRANPVAVLAMYADKAYSLDVLIVVGVQTCTFTPDADSLQEFGEKAFADYEKQFPQWEILYPVAESDVPGQIAVEMAGTYMDGSKMRGILQMYLAGELSVGDLVLIGDGELSDGGLFGVEPSGEAMSDDASSDEGSSDDMPIDPFVSALHDVARSFAFAAAQ